MAWVLNFDGHTFREADLTIDEAERMEVATNLTWRFINPLRSAGNARAVLEVLLQTRLGMSAEEAKAKVGALKVDEYLSLLSYEEEDADLPTQWEDGFPPEAGESSTP